MRLYLVRHAIAAPHGTPGIADDERPLTDAGIKKMKQAARGLRSLDVLPEVVLSSPLPRARHTAEILIDVFGKKVALNLTEALSPSGSRGNKGQPGGIEHDLHRHHDKHHVAPDQNTGQSEYEKDPR